MARFLSAISSIMSSGWFLKAFDFMIVNAKVNMYKTANVKMYSGVHVFSFHSSWNEKKTAPYNVSERRMRHEGVNTSRINNF